MTAATPGSAGLLADRLQRAVDKAGTEWAYHSLIIEAITALRLAAKPAEVVREATIEECAKVAAGFIGVAGVVAAIRALSTTGAPKP